MFIWDGVIILSISIYFTVDDGWDFKSYCIIPYRSIIKIGLQTMYKSATYLLTQPNIKEGWAVCNDVKVEVRKVLILKTS
jgi:hypothetical protein